MDETPDESTRSIAGRQRIYEKLENHEGRIIRLETTNMSLEAATRENTDAMKDFSEKIIADKTTRESERKTLAFLGKALVYGATIVGGPQLLHWVLALVHSIM